MKGKREDGSSTWLNKMKDEERHNLYYSLNYVRVIKLKEDERENTLVHM
jgi:hypothetical protein